MTRNVFPPIFTSACFGTQTHLVSSAATAMPRALIARVLRWTGWIVLGRFLLAKGYEVARPLFVGRARSSTSASRILPGPPETLRRGHPRPDFADGCAARSSNPMRFTTWRLNPPCFAVTGPSSPSSRARSMRARESAVCWKRSAAPIPKSNFTRASSSEMFGKVPRISPERIDPVLIRAARTAFRKRDDATSSP